MLLWHQHTLSRSCCRLASWLYARQSTPVPVSRSPRFTLGPQMLERRWCVTDDTASATAIDCPFLRHTFASPHLKAYGLRLLVHYRLNPGILALRSREPE